MKYYKESLKKPFENFGRLSIGMAMQAIPVVNVFTNIFVSGYLLKYANEMLKGHFELPEWNDFKGFFRSGIKVACVNLIYMLPLLPIFIWSIINLAQVIDSLADPAGSLMVLVVLSIISMVYMIFFFFISPALQLNLAKNLKIKDAFDLREILRTAFSVAYLKTYTVVIVTILIINLLTTILSFILAPTIVIPVILVAYSMMVSQIFMYTFFVLNIEIK